MLKRLLIFLCIGFVPVYVGAQEFDDSRGVLHTPGRTQYAPTSSELACAQAVFRDALNATSGTVEEDDPEWLIEAWVFSTFQDREVNKAVAACIAPLNLADDDIVNFPPVGYRFPGDTDPREIIVNYSVAKKMITQRAQLADKRTLPAGPPTERIGADPNVEWVNTNPAWYGIMVVQANSLLGFAGPGKNNTISLDAIKDNLDVFYPNNNNGAGWNMGGLLTTPMCVSKSALADDGDIVNMAARRATGETAPDAQDLNIFGVARGGNDYYVAGDVNLQWISWAEIAGDVAFKVLTYSAGTYLKGVAKAARVKDIEKTVKGLRGTREVQDYVTATRWAARLDARAANMKNIETALAAATKAGNAQEIAAQTRRLNQALKAADNAVDAAAAIKKLTEDAAEWLKFAAELKEISPNVGHFVDATNALNSIREVTSTLDVARRAAKMSNTGNKTVRGFRVARAQWKMANIGGRSIYKAEKAARAGIVADKTRNWLFARTAMKQAGNWAAHRGLETVSMTGSAMNVSSILSLGMDVAKGMYDWTETEVAQFTSNVMFKPLLLLSGDNLEGYENEVNHGMWLMWTGDSTNPADDDAAFLQAMDFAAKFHQDMEEVQDDYMYDNSARQERGDAAQNAVESEENSELPTGEQKRIVKQSRRKASTTNSAFAIAGLAVAAGAAVVLTGGAFVIVGVSLPVLGTLVAGAVPGTVLATAAAAMPALVTAGTITAGTVYTAGQIGTAVDSGGYSIAGKAGFCDVDIYVVRPIIRNPDSDNPELYYLIMNDEPWRVRSE
ncbi:MAG: hypothetical protein FWG39_03350 [Alphaproteobacteria bacterium]|nr:hypothetical protein [Alphaproteobacteria bacterium]